MCLTTPVKIKKIIAGKAEFDDGRLVDISLIKDAKAGDWVLANADLAISKITEKEANEIKNYFK